MKPTTSLSRPSVLLVEDTLSLQMVYRSILATAGHRVAVAGTAADGLEQFRTHRPLVVLLDLILPDRDGLEVMREIQAIQPETRVIAITANGSVNRAVEAMRAGAHDFLVKPFDEGRFLSAVQNALAEANLRDTADILEKLDPAFVSVTYGAGGTTRETTRDTVLDLVEHRSFPAMPHLTCVGHSHAEVLELIDDYRQNGVHNMLALAGDPPADGSPDPGDFRYAIELVELLQASKGAPTFGCNGSACVCDCSNCLIKPFGDKAPNVMPNVRIHGYLEGR